MAPARRVSPLNCERKIPWCHEPSSQDKADYDKLRSVTNRIETTKYTKFTFLPKGLGEQFRKQANFYFLVVISFMFVGTHTDLWVGTIAAWSTAAMLGSMITVSLAVSWFDDKAREKSDIIINERIAEVAVGHYQFANDTQHARCTLHWQEIRVGDVLKLKDGEEIPADIVILTADSRSQGGLCYVSTANLDGETDLKLKHAIFGAENTEVFRKCQGDVWAEAPQNKLYSFNGRLEVIFPAVAVSQYILNVDNVLLRGCVIKNTNEVIGLVIYTGRDTRIMMNSHATTPSKLSNLERAINSSMWVAVAAQALLALAVDVAYNTSEKNFFRHLWYLYPNGYTQPSGALPDLIAYLIMFFVLYSNFVPVSLYATMEVCNTAYAVYIANDSDMEYQIELQEGKRSEKMPAVARATNLCHDLGQVSYIFSDKTGTLTKNVMTLVHVAMSADPSCERDVLCLPTAATLREDLTSAAACDVWEVLSVCHTGAWNPVGQKLEFESPDEEALVRGAAEGGWHFWRTTNDTTELRLGTFPEVQEERQRLTECDKLTYKILAVNKFTSARKRMSVVVEKNDRKMLLIKGADNVMDQCVRGGLSTHMKRQLFEFSKGGLRTLVVGVRNLDQFDFESWMARYNDTCLVTNNREAALEELASSIEQEVSVVGCTAIEDELQDGVEETVVKVRRAGIKLWVLTGDKMETAISIGFSTRVLQHDGMDIIVLATASERRASSNLPFVQFHQLHEASRMIEEPRNTSKKGLVITGDMMMELAAEPARSTEFINVAKECDVVILARCSPLQKAQMVKMVRENVVVDGILPEPVTLAIGDGANDVPMIMAAHVGVGIFGREGHQAANSSDFAIGQFKFLQNLLFVHGRSSYLRASKITIFTFWRNAVQVILMCFYTPLSGYSGTTLFEDNLRITFNLLCTIPIIATGVFDRDITSEEALKNPELYNAERGGGFELTPLVMLRTLGSAFVHSNIIMTAVICAYPAFEMNQAGDYWTIGCFTYTLLVHAVATRAAFLTSTWNVWSVFLLFLSYFMYAIFLAHRDHNHTFVTTCRPSTEAKHVGWRIIHFTAVLRNALLDISTTRLYHKNMFYLGVWKSITMKTSRNSF